MNDRLIIILSTFILILTGLSAKAQTGLPKYWETTVVMLEKVSQDSKGSPIILPLGTGFFIEDSLIGNCLITNQHVLANRDSIYVRLNSAEKATEKGDTAFYRAVCILKDEDGNSLWAEHHDPRIDVAAVQLVLPKIKTNTRVFELFRLSKYKDLEVGEKVYFFGFPLLLYGLEGQGDTPILRSGIVSFKTEKFTYLANQLLDSGVFLIDGFSFPGNSGSPVLLPWGRSEKASVAGIVFGHIPNTTNIEINIPSTKVQLPTGDSVVITFPPDTVSIQENAGLAKVICSDMIFETILELRKKVLTKE